MAADAYRPGHQGDVPGQQRRLVFGDDDGVLFVDAGHAGQVLAAAHRIWQVEREQARRIRAGQTLRQQTDFAGYLARRAADPSYTFRRHLRHIGGAIEE